MKRVALSETSDLGDLGGSCPPLCPLGVEAVGPWASQEGVAVWTLAQGQLPGKVTVGWVLAFFFFSPQLFPPPHTQTPLPEFRGCGWV